MAEGETAEVDASGSGVLGDTAPLEPPLVPNNGLPGVALPQPDGIQTPTAGALPSPAPTGTPPADTKRRLRDIPPTLGILGVLVVLTLLSIVGGLVSGGDTALGKTCVVALIPAFSIAIGIAAAHWYSKRGLDQQLASVVQNATYTTLHLKRSVQYVDGRLSLAMEHLDNSRPANALLEVVRAKTATELSVGTAQQSSRQWESVSEVGAHAAQLLFVEDDGELKQLTPQRPRMELGNNPKTVAHHDDRADGDENGE